jgi:hypothetical protein
VDGRAGDDRLTTLAGGQLRGGPGDDRLLGDASPSCGVGDDLAQPIRALAPDCERMPVYIEDVAVQLQPLHPRGGRVRLLFRSAGAGVRGRRNERLRGSIRVRRAGRRGRGQLLARGALSVPRVQLPPAGVIRAARLTAAGRRAARSRRPVPVTVSIDLGGQVSRYPTTLRR